MLTVLEVRNPRHTAHNHFIDMDVLFAEYAPEWLPYSAEQGNTEGNGDDLYSRALAGEFGPIAPYVEPAQTQEQIVSQLTAAVQEHLDATARERSYDGILSLCTYAAGSNERFAAEGQAGVEWREAVWARCYEVLAECQAGTRAVPTPEELIAMLPVFEWP